MIGKKKIIMAIIFILGFMVFLYPIVSNIAHSTSQTRAIYRYNKEVKRMEKEERKKQIEEAKKYNESLIDTEIKVEDPYGSDKKVSRKDEKDKGKKAKYISAIDVKNIIGDIEIPKIGVNIPIYRGTSELALQKGAGHMEGTSLPIGGKGSHAVLTAHRGLPSSRLFRNLNKLTIGDKFYIHNMEGTIAYEVDDINVVLPYETERIEIDKNKDYVTLVTCEPYMINTHRLLVRGIRTAYVKDAKDFQNQDKTNLFYKYRDHILLIFILLLVSIFLIRRKAWFSKKAKL